MPEEEARKNPVACVVPGLLDFAVHLDKHLGRIIAEQGAGRAYGLLAAIVFCETGLVRAIGNTLKLRRTCQ